MSEPRIVTAPDLARPVGYAHAVVAEGRTVHLGGQTAMDLEGRIVGDGLVEQFDLAAANLLAALRAAGGAPEDLVSLQIFTTDVAAYRESLKEIGAVYQRHFGRHYPAMGLFGVTALFDPAAQVELMGVAVLD